MRILLVEDEMRLREALTHMLKKKGYAVDSAADGDSGMEMAAGGIYDILVLDRMLPGRDGLSILKEYRGLGFETPVLPMIIWSSLLLLRNCWRGCGPWHGARAKL